MNSEYTLPHWGDIPLANCLHSRASIAGGGSFTRIGACDGDFGNSNDPAQGFLMAEQKVKALLVAWMTRGWR